MSELGESEQAVVVIGSAAVDAKVQPGGDLAPGGSVPGQIRLGIGGVARNIAECLARFEVPTTLLTAVGDDSMGGYVLDVTRSAGVDVTPSLHVAGGRTGTYLAMLRSGGRLWSVDDMAVLASLTPEVIERSRDRIQAARAVVLDTNLPQESLAAVVALCREAGVSICADPTSPYLASRLKPLVPHLNLVTPNQAEAGILCDCTVNDVDDALEAAQLLVRQGVHMALITMGDMGVVYATASERGHIAAPNVDVVDTTGGSDAMTATVVYALINDFPVDEAVRLAVTAAMLTITTLDTVPPDLSLELLYDSLGG